MHEQLSLLDLPIRTNGELPLQMRGNDWQFLREKNLPSSLVGEGEEIKIVDLFSGSGGLSLGVAEACASYNLKLKVILAVDTCPHAVQTYNANFGPQTAHNTSVAEALSDHRHHRKRNGNIDILLGGPPCQGHSDLNNYSRRNDPKNALMLHMVEAAKIFKPRMILIENVVGALRDRGNVVQTTSSQLQELGYRVDAEIVNFREIGVPQRRRRVFIIATRDPLVHPDALFPRGDLTERNVKWAISDLIDYKSDNPLDQPARSNPTTVERINYLFDNKLFELPNTQRPPCHRDKSHSYDTIYGRLRWNEASQTITSGFFSMCMGRYVHPEKRRTLTAHEAARLQFIPDYFQFPVDVPRTKLATMIGNAVPPKGSFLVAANFFKSLGDTARK